ncbi:MAG: efflux RND transporter permease subunit [Nitrospirota bacterium]
MNIPELSVKRPVSMLMVMLIIIIIGIVAFSKLTIDLMPDIDYPVTTIITNYEGVAPEEIEELLTKPIEDAVSTVSDVKKISSTSQEGVSLVTVEFNWGTDLDSAIADIRERLSTIKAFLPEDVKDPMVIKMDIGAMPVLALTISSKRDLAQLKDLADDIIVPRIERIKGVGQAMAMGGLIREVLIEVDADKLKSRGISLVEIAQKLRLENMNKTCGKITQGPTEYTFRTIGEFSQAKEMEKLIIGIKQGNPVYLRDVSEVKDTFKEQRGYGRLKGQQTVGMIVRKEADANTVAVTDEILRQLPIIEGYLPADVKIHKVFEPAKQIRNTINSTKWSGIEGGIFVVIVLLFFLRNVRPTFIVSLAIPFSIITAFIFMYFKGFTINIMTLSGLIIAMGRLVDDAIVVIENIFRHISAGKDRQEAAIVGATEVSMPIIVSTLTTVAVFFPLVFVTGIAGELFKAFGWVVAYALFASLFVAITLTPMMASKLLTATTGEEKETGWYHALRERYGKILLWCLDHKKKVLTSSLFLLVLSLILIVFIPQEFIPKSDSGFFMARLKMPVGTSLKETSEAVSFLENNIGKIEGIDTVFTLTGEDQAGGARAGSMGMGEVSGVNTGMIMVALKDRKERSVTTDDVTKQIREIATSIPGAVLEINDISSMMMGGKAPVEIKVSGDDLPTLKSIAEEVKQVISKIEGVVDVTTSIQEGNPEFQIIYDREKLSQAGLSIAQAAGVVKMAVGGDVWTRLRQKGEEIDIRVRLAESQRKSIENIGNISLPTPFGTQVLLRDVAKIEQGKGAGNIKRFNKKRLVIINANLAGRKLGDVMKEVKNTLPKIPLPQGYLIDFGGEYEDMRGTFRDLGLMLIFAVVLVYMIMAAQFESLIHPLTIMTSLPFAAIGVFLALFITQQSLNISSFIGIIMLVGIVVTNAIILVDFINQQRKKGLEIKEAVISAARIRLRPILMTAICTFFALLPMALALREGEEEMQGLAIGVMGGLTSSTILTLIIVPIVYIVFDRKRKICHEDTKTPRKFL